MKKKKKIGSAIKVEGFFRLNIVDPDGTIKGDSGWRKNKVVNEGFNHYLVELMLGQAASLRVTSIALGSSGTGIADADTNLAGEFVKRQTVTVSSIASKTAQFVATFNSGLSFITDATRQLNNIGLFGYTSAGSGSMFAGNTFTSSQVASNQNVNVTYQIRFATA